MVPNRVEGRLLSFIVISCRMSFCPCSPLSIYRDSLFLLKDESPEFLSKQRLRFFTALSYLASRNLLVSSREYLGCLLGDHGALAIVRTVSDQYGDVGALIYLIQLPLGLWRDTEITVEGPGIPVYGDHSWLGRFRPFS
jgi:hypothetical protein